MIEQAPPHDIDKQASKKIFELLKKHTGHDFSAYKKSMIHRRIERRLRINQIDTIYDYIRYLEENPLEPGLLFKAILVGVTNFFRDPEVFAALAEKVIPRLLADRAADTPIRIWVPGCSTGEEAYSVAMILREQMDALQRDYPVQIFATDIDLQAIEKARAGIYSDHIAADISAERLARFFTQHNNGYQIKLALREMVVFAGQSLIKDPPFSKLDLISCRNLLIYLEPDLQKKIVPLFHYALNPGGFLLLGNSETLGRYDKFFKLVDRKGKLFQRLGSETGLETVLDFPIPALEVEPGWNNVEWIKQAARDDLQRDIGELEAANEELTATHEALQSAHEELQRTNEALESLRQELQSVSEELAFVNAKLLNKNKALAELERVAEREQ